ncbi:hypothetical protein F5B22DRAFT_182011 [Xylaria bambusicola]|uniref:uncharacterized protein n=1 Tax=Xylaria bambusicola TaxID=326684 RepID=UPI0020072F28|nr:uncharacterized protein F5B22DRAFT_182011 [Xylaria bambusicola]KAI0516825.1 hypothetical protein F5B22DRAFT_182011 [Xylaria bambusicola]
MLGWEVLGSQAGTAYLPVFAVVGDRRLMRSLARLVRVLSPIKFFAASAHARSYNFLQLRSIQLSIIDHRLCNFYKSNISQPALLVAYHIIALHIPRPALASTERQVTRRSRRDETGDVGFCQPSADLTFDRLDNLSLHLGVANGLTVFYFRRPYMSTKLRWSCRSAPSPTTSTAITVISWMLSSSLVDPYRSPHCKAIRCGRPIQWCPPRDLPDIQGLKFFHDALPPSTITRTHSVSFIQAVSPAAATYART